MMWQCLFYAVILISETNFVLSQPPVPHINVIKPTLNSVNVTSANTTSVVSNSTLHNDSHPKESNKNVTDSHFKDATPVKNSSIPFEGGGFISVSPKKTKVTIGKSVNNTTEASITINKVGNKTEMIAPKTNVPFEGGGSVHVGDRNSSKSDSNLTVQTSSSPVKSVNDERKISARKGVNYEDMPPAQPSANVSFAPTTNKSSPVTQAPTTVPHRIPHKPLFAMIVGDHESKEPQSFIESPTTGKDYVFPLVLAIMALPLVALAIKMIYKRGSEYTARRQYDRMYLIDGMYNTR